ncbi:MAG: HAMP domain-containing histidine kinase [Labilithrix sp.]|nr:HAMP domain-containing histidine kinase [Labilithrix sp.]MCW5812837.1 HAMP domain-containing histidine kinase [Labilithrix sp.]
MKQVALLRRRAELLECEIQRRKELESALRSSLQERSEIEEALRNCLKRECDARMTAERNNAFKDELLGIVGHDLRNPLHTILMAARLELTHGEDLPPHVQKNLERIVTSGVRMQRMIEQLLDLTRDRFNGGIPVEPSEQPLLPIVGKIIEEACAAHPDRRFELTSEPAEGTSAPPDDCKVLVDADRFEQVLSNLVENAVTHGSATDPVRVAVKTFEQGVAIDVYNQGPPIDPALLPTLFDPFKRTRYPCTRSAGLGLGLYIADRIVRAHDGRIAVESAAEKGTCFHVELGRVR